MLCTPSAGSAQSITPADLIAGPQAEADHRIAYGTGPLHFGDLYLPTGNGPHPVLAFIHGGCFLSAFDLAHTANLARAIAEEGYAVWSIEYRRVGNEGGGWPGTFQDVGRGIDHLREIAASHSLDLDRTLLAGHSAGGTLALWAADRADLPRTSEAWAADPLPVKGVFGLAAVGDLEGVWMTGVCGNVVDRLMGGSPTEVPGRWAAASPMQLAPVPVPATLVVGALDTSWTPPSLAYFHRARTVGGEGLRLVELPESGHFEMISPLSTSWPQVLEELHAAFRRMAPGG